MKQQPIAQDIGGGRIVGRNAVITVERRLILGKILPLFAAAEFSIEATFFERNDIHERRMLREIDQILLEIKWMLVG